MSMELSIQYGDLSELVTNATAKKDLTEAKLSKAKTSQIAAQALLKARENVVALVQITAKETQEQLKFRIEPIVQEALDAVFPGYRFVVDYEDKNDRTEAVMYLEEDGEPFDPLEDNGGGLADVLAFALRLVAWSLGKSDPVLFLDEPGKNVSNAYRPIMMEMLSGLSSKLGLQTIVITHDTEIIEMADRIFETIKLPNRRAKVTMR